MSKHENKHQLTSSIKFIPLREMFVDYTYQRPLRPLQVDRLKRDLDLGAIGVLCLSDRGNGTYAILDGQHRQQALMESGFEQEGMDCEVFKGLTIDEEARIFRERNTRQVVQVIELFKARVAEKQPKALAMLAILSKYGWVPSTNAVTRIDSAVGHLKAINTFEKVYDLDPLADPNPAERTLYVLTKAWGHASYGVTATLFEGVGMFLKRHGDAVNLDDLAERLAKTENGPAGVIGSARTLKAMHGSSTANAIAEVVTGAYNRGRRTTQVAPWRS